jgi:tetratricopeptide (TPR) repeat protein
MTTKIGRNAPCPCGSGNKYKRCCGSVAGQQQSAKTPSTIVPLGDWMLMSDADDLDELSNAVVELLDQSRIADAESAWEKLNDKYPDMIDVLDRKAMILEAKGEHATAADYYRQASDYARTHDGFEEETAQYFLDKAQQLLASAGS